MFILYTILERTQQHSNYSFKNVLKVNMLDVSYVFKMSRLELRKF